jgi:hypothetical protein
MRMNRLARLTGSISFSAARHRRSYSSLRHRLTLTLAHLLSFDAIAHDAYCSMNACGSGCVMIVRYISRSA